MTPWIACGIMPFEDLGFAKVDHHRALRNGMPEVIFGQGKTPAQVARIFARLAKHGGNILATRASEKQFAAVKKKVRAAEYRELWRAPSFCSAIARSMARASSLWSRPEPAIFRWPKKPWLPPK